MKVAVTGASGFVGRYVLAELGRRNIETIAVTRDTKRLLNMPACARIAEMDISRAGVNCFSELGRPDGVIHLAWDGLPN